MKEIRADPTRVLVIDVGGTNVKLLLTGKREPRRFASGSKMTAGGMVDAVEACHHRLAP